MDKTSSDSTLYRIAVLLFWLAGHAERAATVSPAMRRTVLHVLRNGEFAALGLLFDMLTNGRAVPSFEHEWDAVEGDEPEDAMLLAARLRLLAFTVANMAMLPEACTALDRLRGFEGPQAASRGHRHHPAFIAAGAVEPAYHDTS